MLGETQPYDRHTPGTSWHMRSDTLATHMDTLALDPDTLAQPRLFGPAATGTHTQTQVGARTLSALHSPVVEPLVVGCSDEARVSEPGPGTDPRTSPPHVPVKDYLGGGFITPYANSIGSSVIEQISCLVFGSKSFSGKILSYILVDVCSA